MKFLEYRRHIAKTLTDLRKNHGYTQKDIASKLCMDVKAYASYEAGRNAPPLEKLLSLCEIYGITPNTIIGYEDIATVNAICKKYGIQYQTVDNDNVSVTLPQCERYSPVIISKVGFLKTLFDLQNEIDEFMRIEFGKVYDDIKSDEIHIFQHVFGMRASIYDIPLKTIINNLKYNLEQAKILDDIVKRKNKTYKDVEKLQEKGLTYEQIIKKFEKE